MSREAHAYATINGTNMLTTYKMELLDYDTGSPVALTKYIEVPGRPGLLDATLALNGKVNYSTRPIMIMFHIRDIKTAEYMALKSTLMKLFNGTESKVVFSPDPDWYYKGRFKLEFERENNVTAKVTFTCDEAFPYKLEEYTVEYDMTSSSYRYPQGKTYNGPVTFTTNKAASVSYKGTVYQLVAGENVIPEIHFTSGSNTVRFNLSEATTITLTYERGEL